MSNRPKKDDYGTVTKRQAVTLERIADEQRLTMIHSRVLRMVLNDPALACDTHIAGFRGTGDVILRCPDHSLITVNVDTLSKWGLPTQAKGTFKVTNGDTTVEGCQTDISAFVEALRGCDISAGVIVNYGGRTLHIKNRNQIFVVVNTYGVSIDREAEFALRAFASIIEGGQFPAIIFEKGHKDTYANGIRSLKSTTILTYTLELETGDEFAVNAFCKEELARVVADNFACNYKVVTVRPAGKRAQLGVQ